MSYEARKREEARSRAQPGWRASVERFRERVGEAREKYREASASREAERDRRSREELRKLREEEARLRTRKQVRETKGRVQRMRMEDSPLGCLALGAAERAKPQRPTKRPRPKKDAPPGEEPAFGFMGVDPFGFEPLGPAKRRRGKQRGPFEDWP